MPLIAQSASGVGTASGRSGPDAAGVGVGTGRAPESRKTVTGRGERFGNAFFGLGARGSDRKHAFDVETGALAAPTQSLARTARWDPPHVHVYGERRG
jgi:hypothetical protein